MMVPSSSYGRPRSPAAPVKVTVRAAARGSASRRQPPTSRADAHVEAEAAEERQVARCVRVRSGSQRQPRRPRQPIGSSIWRTNSSGSRLGELEVEADDERVLDTQLREQLELEAKQLAPAYESFEALLADERVDVVHLTTPNHLHYPQVSRRSRRASTSSARSRWR